MFDDRNPIPVYVRLAAMLREQIIAGQLRPGGAVPSEQYLADQYGVSRQTARKATEVLRNEGWVATQRARGSVVRSFPEPRVIEARPGATVRARLALPTDPFFAGEDVTIEVTQPGGEHETGPASRTVVQVTGPDAGS